MPFPMDAAVFFPFMRSGLAPAAARDAVLFFNPGVNADPARLLPIENPPLDEAGVREAIGRFESLAEGVRTPRDLETLRSMLRNDEYAQTSSLIAAELADRMTPGRPEAARKKLVQAQTLLCLACKLEDRLVELHGLSEGLTKTWDKFGETLGVEDDDDLVDSALPGAAFTPQVSFEDDFRIPWTGVLEALLAFLPPSRPLFLTDGDIAEIWLDRGLGLEKADPASLKKAFLDGSVPAGEYHIGTYPGYRLALSNRQSEDKPWLDAPRTVIIGTFPEV